ncbi:hypothetical protein DEU56DRAFT_823176 [Suillus clintonianus]|uniref:uncharacterized protein n=1 Tax=Suillus clintonianus TaxID=1904413 RepID=UPI001B8669FF|nr:uncharacterized protein DEU56DRAFT_823176 [Suillus clintonianus]KAG2126039.1 hypothetical protein DEU56DRAFT_823176 [Suillus clintonianus]
MKFILPATLAFITSVFAKCSYTNTSSSFRILLSSEVNCGGSTLEMEQGKDMPCACAPVPSGLVGNLSSIVTQASSVVGEVRLFLDLDCSGVPYGKCYPPASRSCI